MITTVFKKHFKHTYTDRGLIGRRSKITWFKLLSRIRRRKYVKKINKYTTNSIW